MEILALVAMPFVLALVAPALVRHARPAAPWLLAAPPAAATVWLLSRAPAIAAGAALEERHAWVPTLGVDLALRLDGLSLLFAALVTGIGALVVVYAGGYLHGHRHEGRFLAALLAFMGSMLGLVLADDVILLFVCWELTSVTSFLLVGFESEDARARRSALQALYVTAGGGLALLAGLVLLAHVGGTGSIGGLAAAGDAVREHRHYLPVLLLVGLGAATKSAQVPFHFWLPDAMAAPTPASAYLHSATMVKAGVYLLMRLHPALGGTLAWGAIFTTLGAATALTGAYLALKQTDFKRMLAYSTVSALGTMVLLLGLGTPVALAAAVVVLLGHALYKGALFMVAGAGDHATGTRDLDMLGGLRRAMPVTAAVAALAALSLAGVAPLFGFVGKELLLEAALGAPHARPLVAAAVAASAALLVAVAAVAGLRVFWGPARPTPHAAHEPGAMLLLGPAVLGLCGLALGLAPGLVGDLVLPGATAAIAGEAFPRKLALWHGLQPALLASLVVLAAGALAYRGWGRMHARPLPAAVGALSPSRAYDTLITGAPKMAKALTRRIQQGRLRLYVAVVFALLVGLAGYALAARAGMPDVVDPFDVRPHELVIALLMMAGALMAAIARSRVAAITAIGVVGYGAAITYAGFGAPDLAMTQFLFETLSVVLFALVLPMLPPIVRRSSPSTRARDALLATFAGVVMAGLVLVASAAATRRESVSGYFAQTSWTEAFGRNVVNVILVDYRALDTMGEITVLAVASLGVVALLRANRRAPGKAGAGAAAAAEAAEQEAERP